MQSNFLPKLINDPLGDPGVMVEFLCEQRALQFDLGDLSSTTNGELLKISYIVDTVYNEANKKRIVDLVRGSDILFCESPFLAEEEARGQERCHLTARQAGIIAREAEVKKLNVFHFSGRHTFRTEQIIQEAEKAFRGE